MFHEDARAIPSPHLFHCKVAVFIFCFIILALFMFDQVGRCPFDHIKKAILPSFPYIYVIYVCYSMFITIVNGSSVHVGYCSMINQSWWSLALLVHVIGYYGGHGLYQHLLTIVIVVIGCHWLVVWGHQDGANVVGARSLRVAGKAQSQRCNQHGWWPPWLAKLVNIRVTR